MQHKKESSPIKKILLGTAVRCPNCEQGHMFDGLFKMNETCPICEVRFERAEGESIGGMMFTLGLAEVLALAGYFITHAMWGLSVTTQLIIWGLFSIVFCILFYRNGRGTWVGIVYLSGNVYKDGEKEK